MYCPSFKKCRYTINHGGAGIIISQLRPRREAARRTAVFLNMGPRQSELSSINYRRGIGSSILIETSSILCDFVASRTWYSRPTYEVFVHPYCTRCCEPVTQLAPAGVLQTQLRRSQRGIAYVPDAPMHAGAFGINIFQPINVPYKVSCRGFFFMS